MINGEFTTIASRTLERLAGYEISAEAANLARGGAAETKTFYRAMSNAEYGALESNGGLSSMKGKELFVSTVEDYSRAYLKKPGYDVLVQFETLPNTLEELAEFGVKHSEVVGEVGFGHLPDVATGWMQRGQFLFKYETLKNFPHTEALTIGLGNPSLFNQNIINFFKIP